MNIPNFNEIIEPNDQTEARREHLEKLRELTGNVYPNKFARSAISGGEDTISAIKAFEKVVEIEAEMAAIKANLGEGERPPAELKDALNERLKALGNVRIAGRLTTPPRGNFVHLTDGMERLQIYCDKKGGFGLVRNDAENSVDAENGWNAWKLIDHGDFVGVEGYLFVTNTGEVSVHVEKLQFLAKAMLPMPDKMHGIADAEIRQRQRYYDLIGSSLQVKAESLTSEGGQELTTREVFERRAKLISSMRRYLEDHGYIEVETPMLTPKATGAAAKPFETHHNALDITLYARIAPELYLKRLVVGGFEKVYELNRNFRNEGISYKHNPEFTMLEFYCAYMDVDGMMDFCEKMLQESVQKATGGKSVAYEGNELDFTRFHRTSMTEAIVEHFDLLSINPGWFDDVSHLRRLDAFLRLVDSIRMKEGVVAGFSSKSSDAELLQESAVKQREALNLRRATLWAHAELFSHGMPDRSIARIADISDEVYGHIERNIVTEGDFERKRALIIESYFARVEPMLIQPTFIIDFPKSISPLSKASPENPQIAERFELFINGMEVANGFSELNDPKEQYERFVDQMSERERGDEEAMVLDEDYIRALSYGMPPAAGIGIGIDRLVMLLTNKHSIRDVILFPHMRPERPTVESEAETAENA